MRKIFSGDYDFLSGSQPEKPFSYIEVGKFCFFGGGLLFPLSTSRTWAITLRGERKRISDPKKMNSTSI